jgi:hypothetical protein
MTALELGCQIFLGATHQNGKKYTKMGKIYQNGKKYTKMGKNVLNDHKMCQMAIKYTVWL